MNNLIKQFSVIHRQTGIRLEKSLKPLGVPYGQFMYILCICDHEGLSQEKLSAELQIDKGSVARTVSALEKQGFIERVPSTEDRRQNRLLPTEKAREAYVKITQVIRRQEARLVKNLSEIEEDLLRSLLDKIIENI